MNVDHRLSVEPTHSNGVLVLELRGEIDSFTAPRFQEIVRTACRSGVPVVLDMASVSFMDSAGLSALLAAAKAADGTRYSVQVTRPSDQVQRTLSLTGLDKIFLLDS